MIAKKIKSIWLNGNRYLKKFDHVGGYDIEIPKDTPIYRFGIITASNGTPEYTYLGTAYTDYQVAIWGYAWNPLSEKIYYQFNNQCYAPKGDAVLFSTKNGNSVTPYQGNTDSFLVETSAVKFIGGVVKTLVYRVLAMLAPRKGALA